ncbi:unnamed protein product [Cylicocyclus nassatus]|uniref:Uncharacterized protein n=1 Tax=Cylicocyclus nassatus TaxID=53992 RepID=A0AA36MEW2_CYLNA|nr:unnamed protein product [Cylicocyclus nassatus]
MFALLLLLFSIALIVDGGAVGECRTECVEQNRYKIVRVHLKDDLVMVGICRNTTMSDDGYKSIVVPMICNRDHGIWTIDTEDEEGVARFNVRCPPNDPVKPVKLITCPKSF